MIDAWTEDILFSGSKEEIDEVRCNCGASFLIPIINMETL